jgi:hypothetical protein
MGIHADPVPTVPSHSRVRRANREERRKTMNRAIRTGNLKATMGIVLIAGLLLMVTLVFVLQPATTTSNGGSNAGVQAPSADSNGGSSLTHDPYIDRHAEVVARYHEGSLR